MLTCKSTGRRTVTCKVGAASKGAAAKLVRKGRTVARATVRKGKLVFRSGKSLKRGRYSVVIGDSRSTLRIG